MRSVSTASLLLAAALITGCASVPDSPPAKIRLDSVSMFSGNSAREGLPDGWQTWTLSRFKRPTEYRLVTDNGITVLRARASSSASGLIHPLDLDPAQYRFLHWHWKVEELIKGADNSRKSTEDSPVRVVVSFAGDLDKLSFDDRVFFDQVKAIAGQQLPYATLMYIWENRAPVDTVLPNLHTSRIKMIVADSGDGNVGQWQERLRNVVEDFKKAFGEEPGRITSVAVMTDTDNTGESALA